MTRAISLLKALRDHRSVRGAAQNGGRDRHCLRPVRRSGDTNRTAETLRCWMLMRDTPRRGVWKRTTTTWRRTTTIDEGSSECAALPDAELQIPYAGGEPVFASNIAALVSSAVEMDTRSQSAAIGRVFDLAARLALASDSEGVDSAHVLAALWQDESRAQEILAAAGVGPEDLRTFVGSIAPAVEVPPVPAAEMEEPLTLALTPVVQQARRAARGLASELGRHAEMGTEHLLLGLIECDAQFANWLTEQGISLVALREDVVGAQGLDGEPIAVDIALTPVVRSSRETVRIDRLLDAAANRAREGLRVVEDFVRFVLDDAHLSRLLKEHRHRLTSALSMLPGNRMLAARDTMGDVGTQIQTPSEQHRDHATDVVRANCKRVEEALRTLEEYSKTLAADAAAQFEQLRYLFYTIEQAVIQTFRARQRLQDARLYLLVTDRNCPQGCGPVIRAALRGGVDVVQLREKQMPDRRLLDLALSVREWTAAAGALFIVNDRPDIAAACAADGVHLGQDDMEVRHARQIVGGESLIGVSTHSLPQAQQAVVDGADYLGVGPVFPSTTKQFASFPGLALVGDVAREITRPWFALGGVDLTNIAKVIGAGASRVALSAAIGSADDPAAAATALRRALMAGEHDRPRSAHLPDDLGGTVPGTGVAGG